MTLSLIQLSDIHICRLTANPLIWLGKPALGMINHLVHRRWVSSERLAAQAVERILAIPSAVVLCAGDLTTTALPREFRRAAELLSLFQTASKTIIASPGNHDRYTRRAVRRGWFEASFGEQDFPVVNDIRTPSEPPLRIIQIETCVPSGLSSQGFFDPRQADPLMSALKTARESKSLTIVMAHYPFVKDGDRSVRRPLFRRDLRNADALIDALSAYPPDLYLHGHTHRARAYRSARLPSVLCIDSGSLTSLRPGIERAGGFNEIRFENGKIAVVRHYCFQSEWSQRIMEPSACD
mgnify:CR=1 FL=1